MSAPSLSTYTEEGRHGCAGGRSSPCPTEWTRTISYSATAEGENRYTLFALDPIGFVPASALFFVAVAWILGSRRIVRDAVTGVLLALAVYLSFTRLLEIGLPSGVLPL